jgi:hypothetical protein
MHIYISYGRHDSQDFAQRLSSWLCLLGYDTWLDIGKGIPPGTPVDPSIEEEIRKSDYVLALLSEDSVSPESVCRDELRFANIHKIPILPVRIADVPRIYPIVAHTWLDASTNPESVFFILPDLLNDISEKADAGKSTADGGSNPDEKIPVIAFDNGLKCYAGSFTGREWLFETLNVWVAGLDSRFFFLTGEVGIGKTALCARLTSRMKVKGIHFFHPSDPESSRPESVISSFTCQFSRQFPAYREILEQITPPDPTTPPEARFKMLVTDPLLACEDRLEIGSPWIVLLDGLDEAAARGGTAMIDFIAESVERFPPWFRVIITSRPDQELLDRFQGINIRRMNLSASSIDNLVDIEEYIQLREPDQKPHRRKLPLCKDHP